MPELPEVEVIRWELTPLVCGKHVARTMSGGQFPGLVYSAAA